MKWCLSRKPKRILEGWPSKNETDICIGFPRMCTTENMTNMRNETKRASQNTAIYHYLEFMKHSTMMVESTTQISLVNCPDFLFTMLSLPCMPCPSNLRSHQQLCPPWRWFFSKRKMGEDLVVIIFKSRRIHVWNIYLHLVDLYGKFR